MKSSSAATHALERWVQAHPVVNQTPVLADALALVCQHCADAPAVAGRWASVEPEVADTLQTLMSLEAGVEPLAACILNALLESGAVLAAAESAAISPAVRDLLDGQQAAEQVWSLYATRTSSGGAEGLRRLLLSIIRDLRVVFILVARQLARLRAASALPPEERRALARLTADIHAPLANRLGIWQLKWELEDLVFRELQPETYQRIARLLDERRGDREVFIANACDALKTALHKAGVEADVAGRPKHIYSIWRKMQRKGLEFSGLYDIRALRVLVADMPSCYAALGVVHSLWPHIPGEFDDYITTPKGNQYQSLHTAVTGPEGKALEVQIRSHEMHQHAELGFAAHWRYKEGGSGDASFERKIAWMRQLLDSKEDQDDDAALLAGFRTDVLDDRVYLLSPKGLVVDLPRGATVLDFAYSIHTDVGHRCRGAKVNGRIVPLNHQPSSGERVEILTGKTLEPRRDWLAPHHGYLNTARGREKVRAWFKRIDRGENLAAGRALLERELKRLAVAHAEVEDLPARFDLRSTDDLYEALALGDVTPGQIARVLHEATTPRPEPAAPVARSNTPPRGVVTINGVGNLLTALARCCQPLPGDPITGFITRGRGVSVHRADCVQLDRLRARDMSRIVEVEWGGRAERAYEVDVLVKGYDRKYLHKDVTNAIASTDAHLLAVNTRMDHKRGLAEMNYTLRVRDFDQLSGLLHRILAVSNVVEARRLA